ncbi:MAG: cation:proton antiporter [Thermodesulfobacteriota bacterium]
MAISIAVIIILGLSADYLFRKIKVPGLVGMLLAGILVGPYVLGLMRPEMMDVSGDFRKIALIVILLRAGFELHRDTLNRVGRGAKKGIPTLILGASSVDDVFVIVIFTILMGMHGGEEVNLWLKLTEIPVSISLGILAGIIPGYLLYLLFKKYDWRPPKRTMMVMGVAIFLTWLEKAAEGVVPVASLLGVMAIGFIILEKSEPIAHLISQKLKKLWVFAELLLFVLVGAQVNIHVAWRAGLAGIAVIAIGLIFRSAGTYLSLLGTPMNFKEKLFCIVAYIPKATVQAAIGAVPLAAGIASGELILAVAVLSILVTAPIGAFGIMAMGDRILDYSETSAYRFRELREQYGLPRVGERVRNKDTDTVWKVIEKKEDGAKQPGRGKTRTLRYSKNDPSFNDHWEVLYDW